VEGPDLDPVEEAVDLFGELVDDGTEAVAIGFELFAARLIVSPLKQRDSSAAALLVKLTSADIPVPKRLQALLQAVRKTIKRQARLTRNTKKHFVKLQRKWKSGMILRRVTTLRILCVQ
jgi:hypothetical protein